MSMTVPFDPTELAMEREAETRARHDSVVWAAASSQPIRNDDYALAEDFEPYEPSGTRLDRFTAEYDDLPIHVTRLDTGVLFGQEFLVCDARRPTVSSDRLYLTRHKRALRRLDLERLHVDHGPTYLVGANNGHRNFYHWNFQCLPAIVLLRDFSRSRGLDYRLALPPLDEPRRRSLELLGVSPREWVTLGPDQFIQDVPLLYTSASCGHYAFQPSARLIELMDPYLDACLLRADGSPPTRFYVSRRDAPGKREIENETELVHALAARGYEELVMSALSIENQVAAFARAEGIVASHGAGLVNTMFSRPKTRLLEILPENYRQAYFFRLAQVRGMSYSQVLARTIGEHRDGDVHATRTRVDVGQVLAALDRSEASSGERAA